MNAIRQTQLLNKRELENATPPSASWHADYRDTAWIYIGGFPLDLSEGDIITIFSQYGNPTHLNMIRDRETGKSKGFAFLKYEDQRSCDLAVDNLGGADVLGRMLRVDHTRYKKKEGEEEDTYRIDRLEQEQEQEARRGARANGKRASDTEQSEGEDEKRRRKKRRPLLKEEKELEEMLAIKQDGEEEDPMRDYLIRQKREDVERAREKERQSSHRHKHKHRHRHRDEEDLKDEEERRPYRHKREDEGYIRKDDQRRTDRRRQGEDDGAHSDDDERWQPRRRTHDSERPRRGESVDVKDEYRRRQRHSPREEDGRGPRRRHHHDGGDDYDDRDHSRKS